MSHAPRSQLTQFELDIISDHSEANSDGSNFVVFWETDNADYNCFAYAVGEEGQFLTPTNMTDVNNIYASYGYFPVESSSHAEAHDVEVYAKQGTPLHAHKIKNARTGECESKMGHGPVISHPRTMLQSARRSQPNYYKFGGIVRRYRYNRREYEKWHKNTYAVTSSGRTIFKNDATKTSSGRVISKLDAHKTRSGRIVKKPQKYKEHHDFYQGHTTDAEKHYAGADDTYDQYEDRDGQSSWAGNGSYANRDYGYN